MSAQNSVVTYQGRVTSNGTNFTGNGQFKFAIVTSTNNNHTATATATTSGGFVTILNVVAGGNGYVSAPAVTISGGGGSGAAATANLTSGAVTSYTINANGSGYSSVPTVTVAAPPQNLSFTTFWSNDGTSSAGSQPTAAVSAVVTNGLFLAALGDATVANMTVIPTSLFVQPNLQLRIWFNDGVSGFAALSPLQNLTPAPYAAFANTASNILGTVAASQLSGTVPNANVSGTYGGAVNFNNSADNFSGAFTGNGAGLTGLNLGSVGPVGTFSSLSKFFTPPYDLTVGLGPVFVAAVDLNYDYKPDLLVSANANDNTMTVLTNAGYGNYQISATLPTGAKPVAVLWGDVNQDGAEDLISVNVNGNTLTIYTNGYNGIYGSGVFGSNATLTVGINPIAAALTDINGDNIPDLIVANYSTPSIMVFTNNGTGRFGSNAVITSITAPVNLAVAEVSGDSWPDLIVANDANNTLTVFTNNTAGKFVLSSTLATGIGTGPRSVAVADVNGDGWADVICANGLTNTLSVFTNNLAGKFGFNSTIVLSSRPQMVTATYFNNNNYVADLVTANYASGLFGLVSTSISVLTNNGYGSFGLQQLLNGGSYAKSVCVADINGDGNMDLIAPNPQNFTTLLNTLTVNLGSVPAFAVTNGVSFTSGANVFNGSFTGNFNGGTFTGNGNGLTSLNAANLTGFVPSNTLNSVPAGNLTGTMPFNVLPGGVETSGSALRVGSTGTTFALIQAGQAIMPSSSTTETNFTITFPQVFSSSPRILVSVANDPGFQGVNDIFATSISSNSATAFRVNVIRLDTTGGWSQQLRINWQAWQ